MMLSGVKPSDMQLQVDCGPLDETFSSSIVSFTCKGPPWKRDMVRLAVNEVFQTSSFPECVPNGIQTIEDEYLSNVREESRSDRTAIGNG